MESYDLSHLPQPVHDAVLHVLATLVQAFPLATTETAAAVVHGPPADGPPRFPRSPVEIMVLEALEALAPMPASPLQLAGMINKPHLEVRTTLQALAMLGTIVHPGKGYYRHGRPEDEVRPSGRPSALFAAKIAALCAPQKGVDHV